MTMNSVPSNSESTFLKLHPDIQRWVWDQGWTELRSAQVQAATPILEGDKDVIISAATASGKTEAAFLPILSALASNPSSQPGVEVLCISPLKALINDQYERLAPLAERVDLKVTPWHGDVTGSKKSALMKKPSGVLIITPESLEAMFVLRGNEVVGLMHALRYIVVDELHAFIGTERGAQLQSLMHRVEYAIRRRVPRVALSATLGDMTLAAGFLRPHGGNNVKLVVADDDGQALKIQLRGYVAVPHPSTREESEDPFVAAAASADEVDIARNLYRVLRGSNNLIFANTKRNVEIFANLLRGMSEDNNAPNEFFAHHGNLSKDAREFVEKRLKDHSLPANAVCTSTLELGIDIGDVKSIAQIGAPPTVAAIRQRLGRSGRRGDAAVLRNYVAEDEITPKTTPPDLLREELVQSIAMINLLLERWYEPPDPNDLHLSTLIQQLLSVIAQHGGALANEVYSILCATGPFNGVSSSEFAGLLRHLADVDVLMQSPDGTLLLGAKGESIVNFFHFYASFATPEEWRLVTAGRSLGSVPVLYAMQTGMYMVFSGRRWRIVNVDREHKVVDLVPARGGRPPRFSGSGAMLHPRVREEMRRVYQSAEVPKYLDERAAQLLMEGRENFARLSLLESSYVETSNGAYLFPWTGDKIINTLVAMFNYLDAPATASGLTVFIEGETKTGLELMLQQLVANPIHSVVDLTRGVQNKAHEKFDLLLTHSLLDESYAAKFLDLPGAYLLVNRVLRTSSS
jgi:ATP-dependent Lhr-like helicase